MVYKKIRVVCISWFLSQDVPGRPGREGPELKQALKHNDVIRKSNTARMAPDLPGPINTNKQSTEESTNTIVLICNHLPISFQDFERLYSYRLMGEIKSKIYTYT